MSTREVTRWLTLHRRRLQPPEADEVRALYLAAGDPSVDLSELYARRVTATGLDAIPAVVSHPPALVHELLRRAGVDLDSLETLSPRRRRSLGHVLGVAAAMVAGGLLAGGVPSSPGALLGIADAIRRSNALLKPPAA